MMNAILYARFSPRRDADTCESIETQWQACERFCGDRGWPVAGRHCDRALSGSDADRPGLWDAVDASGRGDVLVVYRLDRLARDVYLSEVVRREVGKRGATIAAVIGDAAGDGPEDVLIRQVLQAFAEYERKVIAARTKHAMLRHQAAGRRMSAVAPYGWRVSPDDAGRLIVDHDEQSVVCRIRELHQSGASARCIARRLQVESIPSRGRAWHHTTVTRILARSSE
jgi:DNA invertase Pin-like site-specific DNA recombinase